MVNSARKIVKNTGVVFAAQIFSMICSMAFIIICARYLGDARFGKYAFAVSFATMFAVLGTLNLQAKATRDVAWDRSKTIKYLSNIVPLTIILAIVVFGLSVGVLLLMRRPADITIVTVIFSGIIIFQVMTAGLRWWFQAYQKLEYEALLVSTLSGTKLCLGLLVITLGGGLIALAWVVVAANFLVLTSAYFITKRNFPRLAWEIDLQFWRKFIVKNIPFTLAIIFAAIFGNVDKILLSVMKGDAVTGWYNAAYQVLIPVKAIPGAFSMAILPVFSESYSNNIGNFNNMIQRSFRYMFIIAFPAAIAISVLADKIMFVLFGSAFMNGANALKILIWAASATFINVTMGKAIISSGEERLNAIFCGIGLVINITLNFLLIPKLAHIGTAISILAAEGVISLLVLFWAYRKSALDTSTIRGLIKPVSAALIMGFSLYLLRNITLWILIPFGAGIYLSSLLLMKTFTDEEKSLIKHVFVK